MEPDGNNVRYLKWLCSCREWAAQRPTLASRTSRLAPSRVPNPKGFLFCTSDFLVWDAIETLAGSLCVAYLNYSTWNVGKEIFLILCSFWCDQQGLTEFFYFSVSVCLLPRIVRDIKESTLSKPLEHTLPFTWSEGGGGRQIWRLLAKEWVLGRDSACPYKLNTKSSCWPVRLEFRTVCWVFCFVLSFLICHLGTNELLP